MENTKNVTKIAIIIDSYSSGGVALALREFLKCIANDDFEITVFIRNIDNLLELPNNVLCANWGAQKKLSVVMKKEGVSSALKLLKNYAMAAYHWRNYGKKIIYKARCCDELPGEYDCVIGYHMIANDVTIMTLEKVKAKRKILWLHGQKNFLEKNLKFYDNIYSKADAIVCVAQETENRFRRLMPKCDGKTVTIHNFYDIPYIRTKAREQSVELCKEKDEIIIVSVGRLSKEKGFDRVPPIVKLLREDGYKVKWFVAGDGEQRKSLEKDIAEKRLKEEIYLLGYRENPYPYICNCDIYVQPSYTEGYCTSTMEAKILAKPVVVTDISGMREQFIHEETGIIVESSVEGIYNGIKRLIDEEELRKKIMFNLNSEPISNEADIEKTIKIIKGK